MPVKELQLLQRQVELQRLPAASVVEGHVHPELGPGEEQAPALGVLADDADEAVFRQVAIQPCRATAVVRQLVDVRPEIVHLVTGNRDVGGSWLVWADVDGVDHCALQVAGRHVGPVLAVIAGDVDETVVTADPDLAVGMRG